MGLVWSMRQTGEPLPAGTPFDQLAVQSVHLAATAPSGTAHGSFEQHFVAPGVSVQPIRDAGMVATLFTPPGDGPFPLVVMLSGSGGGLMEARSALFAAHGFAALALGYFGAPGLPPTIRRRGSNISKRLCNGRAANCGPPAGSSRSAASRAAANWRCCSAPPCPTKSTPSSLTSRAP